MTYNSVYEEAEHDIRVADNGPTSCNMTNIILHVVMVTAPVKACETDMSLISNMTFVEKDTDVIHS